MKKSFITALIVLISISLLGLSAIQIYWIKNAIALRDAQFTRNVRVALSEFNHFLEKEEATERIRKHEYGRKLLSQFDSLADLRTNPDLFIGQSALESDTTVYLSEDGNYQFKFNKRKESTLLSEVAPDTTGSRLRPDTITVNSPSPHYFTDAQTIMVAELITGLVYLESGNELTERYTYNELDSLLKRNLAEVGGITVDYEFGIFDAFDEPDLIADNHRPGMAQMIDKGYRIRLFPADIVQNPRYLRIWFPNQESYLLKSIWPLLFSSAVFMLTVIFAFGYTIHTILRQKKVSEIKNDFINNMTHELKTPISTISLACEALADPVMSKSPARNSHYISMIRDENKRLGVLVENVLRSAVLDRKEMDLSREKVDLHEVTHAAIHNIELQAQQKNGRIEKELSAKPSIIQGDKVHLTNVVYNLLDNAIKYSGDQAVVKVSTRATAAGVTIHVEDNGMGIRKEDQARIFEKLYRVPTGDIHNIKGFGLGLSYVKMIVEKHHGTVSVQSEIGKGSTFIIQLPFDYDI